VYKYSFAQFDNFLAILSYVFETFTELQIEKPTEATFETDDEYVALASERMCAAYDIVRSHLRARRKRDTMIV